MVTTQNPTLLSLIVDSEIEKALKNKQTTTTSFPNFGLYLGNVEGSTSGWNGEMKDWHLCLGSGCARDDDFEEFNCADPIEIADKTAEESLGPALPGCELPEYCSTGLYPPCTCEDGEDCPEPEEYSAEVEITWPDVDETGLIDQPHTQYTPTYEVEVEESLLPYVTQYSYGFWYQFRFRSPVRMEVDEKRALTHAVAGVTEHDTYCSKSTLGDRALGIFFKSWDETDVPTYKSCSYDN